MKQIEGVCRTVTERKAENKRNGIGTLLQGRWVIVSYKQTNKQASKRVGGCRVGAAAGAGRARGRSRRDLSRSRELAGMEGAPLLPRDTAAVFSAPLPSVPALGASRLPGRRCPGDHQRSPGRSQRGGAGLASDGGESGRRPALGPARPGPALQLSQSISQSPGVVRRLLPEKNEAP